MNRCRGRRRKPQTHCRIRFWKRESLRLKPAHAVPRSRQACRAAPDSRGPGRLHALQAAPAGRKQIVFGVGNPEAELMFVGEGPGADEDAQGEPFVGRAGQLLNNMISAMGLRREDVYIANVVKCRPPQNRTPERDECETCSPFLMRQIATVRPGDHRRAGRGGRPQPAGDERFDGQAARPYLRLSLRSCPKDAPERDAEFSTKLAVTYHPAYLLRDPRQKKETWKDLQMVMGYLGLATAEARRRGVVRRR